MVDRPRKIGDPVPLGEGGTVRDRYWWVNQGKTWEQERRGGYVWAPTHDPRGAPRRFWSQVLDIEPGNQIVSYVRGALVAISTATTSGYRADRPADLPGDLWTDKGYRADVHYRPIREPLRLDSIPREWRDGGKEDPFRVTGAVKLGYLFPISTAFFDELLELLGER
jgi:hypothetical protein